MDEDESTDNNFQLRCALCGDMVMFTNVEDHMNTCKGCYQVCMHVYIGGSFFGQLSLFFFFLPFLFC